MAAQITAAQALQGYGVIWIVFFLMSLVSAFCCSVFKVPLAEAVNVQLAVTLAMNVFLLGLYSIVIGLLLVVMQFQQALFLLFVAFLYTFFSMAPKAGFQIWAMFTKVDLQSESFMYAMVGDKLQAVIEATLSWAGNLVGADFGRYWPVIKDSVSFASGVAAILSLIIGGRARAPAAA